MRITVGEKLFYFTVFILAFFNKILGSIHNVEDMYMAIVNNKIFTIVYLPIFLYILLDKFSKRLKPEVIIRYQSIKNWSISNLKIIAVLSVRLSITFNVITSIFMVICDTNILYNQDFYVFNYISIVVQSVGWCLIGMLFMNLISITNSIKLAYVLEIAFFLAIRLIMSPLSFISLRDYIVPIWDTMFFYEFNREYMTMIKYLSMNIIIIIILFVIYSHLVKKRDLKIER